MEKNKYQYNTLPDTCDDIGVGPLSMGIYLIHVIPDVHHVVF